MECDAESGRVWEIKSRIRGETPATLLEEFSSRVVKIACGDEHSMALSGIASLPSHHQRQCHSLTFVWAENGDV